MELLRQLIKSFWFILIISVGLGQTLKLENNEDGTWNLIYASPLAIAGFQFNVDNAAVISASGGAAEAAGFTVETSSTTVIGYSLSGATIPPGIGNTLVVLELSGTPTGLSDIVFSDLVGNSMEFTFFWEGCMDDGYQQLSPNFGSPACNYDQYAIIEGECLYNDCLGVCPVIIDNGIWIENTVYTNEQYDNCGECAGGAIAEGVAWCGETTASDNCCDCSGYPNGTAYYDACDQCVGENTGNSDAFDIGIDSSYLEIASSVQNYRIPVNVSNVDTLNSFYMELDYDSTDIQIVDISKSEDIINQEGLAFFTGKTFERIGFLDFNTTMITKSDLYENVISTKYYFYSIVDNLLTPGFDIFNTAKATHVIGRLANGEPFPTRLEAALGDYYQSDMMGIYGEYYVLFYGYPALVVFFVISFFICDIIHYFISENIMPDI